MQQRRDVQISLPVIPWPIGERTPLRMLLRGVALSLLFLVCAAIPGAASALAQAQDNLPLNYWPLPDEYRLITSYPNTEWTWAKLGLNPGEHCPPYQIRSLTTSQKYWRDSSLPYDQDAAQASPGGNGLVGCYDVGTGVDRQHEGTDIKTPAGTPVYASANGVVDDTSKTDECRNDGNCRITIRHDRTIGATTYTWQVRYTHVKNDFPFNIDDKVNEGETIAYVADLGGNSHLHFEVEYLQGRCGGTCIINPWGDDDISPGVLTSLWIDNDNDGRPDVDPQHAHPPVSTATSSSTVFAIDVSASMDEEDTGGLTKLQAAQNASINMLDIIDAENQASSGANHQVGIVTFSDNAYTPFTLSADMQGMRDAIGRLSTIGDTGMAAGLQAGIDMFAAGTPDSKPIIILLSDGLPNILLDGTHLHEDQILMAQQEVIELAQEAGQRDICVYTIGFGIPFGTGSISGGESIDEEFLQQVAANSGCGEYYNAQNASELAQVYVRLRHVSTGKVLTEVQGQITQDELVDVGLIDVPQSVGQLLLTLQWPGSQLDPVLIDPKGTQVNSGYPGATISTSSTIANVVVNDPLSGSWQMQVMGVDVPEGVTSFYTVASIRGTAAEKTSSGFPITLLVVVVVGGGVAAYVITRRKAGVVQTSMARLIGIGGPLAGQTVMITTDAFTIGRGSACQLHLVEPAVSRQHARIRCVQGEWYLQDLGSDGGTFVNGERVSATRLNSGDHITIGGATLLFEFA